MQGRSLGCSFLASWMSGPAFYSGRHPQGNVTQDQTNIWTEWPNSCSKPFFTNNTSSSFRLKMEQLMAAWAGAFLGSQEWWNGSRSASRPSLSKLSTSCVKEKWHIWMKEIYSLNALLLHFTTRHYFGLFREGDAISKARLHGITVHTSSCRCPTVLGVACSALFPLDPDPAISSFLLTARKFLVQNL